VQKKNRIRFFFGESPKMDWRQTMYKSLAVGFLVLSFVMFPACLTFAENSPPKPYPPKALYDESNVPEFTLPDPLIMQNGQKVTDAAMWTEKRRPEIIKLFQTEVYGRTMAPRPEKMIWKLISVDPNAMDGKAITKKVVLYFDGTENGPSMLLDITLPKQPKPVPVYMLAEWGKILPEVINRGYGMIICKLSQIQSDKPDGYANSIRAFFAPPGQKEPLVDEWGAIGVWAWGMSRAMDYVQTDPDIDAQKVCLHGFSRFGKVAVWAGALDQRFAITFSGESGCGGAVLVRRGFGETVKKINDSFPYWFCGNFKKYNDDVNKLPVDWHELIALYAPRPVYIATAEQDRWGDPHGSFLAAKYAEPVYKLFGKVGLGVDAWPAVNTPVGDFIGYHNRTGTHNQTPYDWEQYLNFSDRHFRLNQYKAKQLSQ
jgi:hypothetical protein